MAAIVFDLDGTLIDSARDIHACSNEILAGEGLGPLDYPTVKGFIGKGVPNLVARLLEAAGAPFEGGYHAEVVEKFNIAYEKATGLTEIYPHVVETLESLRAQGHRLGLCTNKPILPTHASLKHLGLAPLFEAVIGGDSLSLRKPDPSPLFATISALGFEPKRGQCVYVGDSETDAETALRAALPFLLYTEGYRKAPLEELPHEAHFSDYKALPALVAAALR